MAVVTCEGLPNDPHQHHLLPCFLQCLAVLLFTEFIACYEICVNKAKALFLEKKSLAL